MLDRTDGIETEFGIGLNPAAAAAAAEAAAEQLFLQYKEKFGILYNILIVQ